MTVFDRAAVATAFSVSRETLLALDALVATLTRWAPRLNLVSHSTLAAVWHRHVADSAQLWRLAPPGAQRWVDLGAGAGFPGLVIAALSLGAASPPAVTLVEADARKCAFLAEAARAMGVSVAIRRTRIEAWDEAGFDVVSARALAPLPALLPMARERLRPGGVALLPKGREAEAELAALSAIDRTRIERLPSMTHPASLILRWTEPDGRDQPV